MKATRVEIFKNGEWVPLILKDKPIKYSIVANRIGSLNMRMISHSNTFSLPYIEENISALEINVFSPVLMAEALNRKYKAKYYVKDKLLQQGYIVVNNTVTGDININFIDEALDLVDQWGTITFKNLLINLIDNPTAFPRQIINTSVLNTISLLSQWNLSRGGTVPAVLKSTFLSDDVSIDNEEFYLARFPVMFNTIGERWQKNVAGVRPINTFNPFQSRPIYSVLGFLYLITQAWGYRLRLDDSVNQDELRDIYLSEKGAVGSIANADSYIPSTTSTILSLVRPSYYFIDYSYFYAKYEFFFSYPYSVTTFDPATGIKVGVEAFKHLHFTNHSPGYLAHSLPTRADYNYWKNLHVLAKIEGSQSTWDGELKWTGNFDTNSSIPPDKMEWRVVAVGYHRVTGAIVERTMTREVSYDTTSKFFKITANKRELRTLWDSSIHDFKGVYLRFQVMAVGYQYNILVNIKNLHFTEANLPRGKVTVDQYGQLEDATTNLNYLAPDVLVKDLLTDILQQQGLLLTFERNSDGVQNVMKIFSYYLYAKRVRDAQAGLSDQYYDWSQYHQKLIPPLYNTDYGSSYGETNYISLKDPFPGNVTTKKLGTSLLAKGLQTKLLPLVRNETKILKDVKAIDEIGDTPKYIEVTSDDKSLIYCSYTDLLLGANKEQVTAEDSTTGIVAVKPPVAVQLPYSRNSIPDGVYDWYKIVDQSVRCEATFLLPIYIIQVFDITKPVYVEALGGFYIVEEIPEYVDDITPIKVKLIKVPI